MILLTVNCSTWFRFSNDLPKLTTFTRCWTLQIFRTVSETSLNFWPTERSSIVKATVPRRLLSENEQIYWSTETDNEFKNQGLLIAVTPRWWTFATVNILLCASRQLEVMPGADAMIKPQQLIEIVTIIFHRWFLQRRWFVQFCEICKQLDQNRRVCYTTASPLFTLLLFCHLFFKLFLGIFVFLTSDDFIKFLTFVRRVLNPGKVINICCRYFTCSYLACLCLPDLPLGLQNVLYPTPLPSLLYYSVAMVLQTVSILIHFERHIHLRDESEQSETKTFTLLCHGQ